ncbi:DNA helicase II [Chlorella sorokiniana]|uniref:DNA 3'-5' helicase n=1 Tax=Chlorella sorokiniana TaxID=3076 RepID=A0A2P6TW52_CHLSO|nr:DNA helicase II [Chlorella sorokiniana]|eukprot:PRW58291.1 DNA helicase II [Chlorella sorokiniana]
MLERVRFALQQGVPAKQLLVLTFSRRAQSEFAARLQQRVPGADEATVATFHAWAWQLVRRHWREAGYARQPAVAANEDQLLSVMRDCLTWDGLEALRGDMAGWLWLPPTAPWAEVAAAAAERHTGLHARCLAEAVSAFNLDPAGGGPTLTADTAAALTWEQLPPRLQLLLICELHDALAAHFRQRQRGGSSSCCEGITAADLLAGAAKQAPAFLHWLECQKRQGRAVDEQAYLAVCAAAHAANEQGQRGGGRGRGSGDAERQKRLVRVGLAFQEAMRQHSLVALADLPLLARQLLAAGGGAAAWARQRWSVVLVDEFQDTGRVLLDLLALLMGDRRGVTAVGDDDQSIYSFLGTEPRIFQEFRDRFAPCTTHCLQLNFRSTPPICALGSSLLRGNRRAAEKSMQPARHSSRASAGSDNDSGFAPVTVQQHGSPEAEAAALAAEVQRLWREEGVPYSSVAVLFRCLRLQGRSPHAPLMAVLRKRGIPFTIANHDRLGDDPAVAALCAYLALAADPGCDPAFEAVLALPHHGLGAEVRGTVAQQRHAARLAGRRAPSLLLCAESVCSQAAEKAAESDSSDGQEQFGPTQLSQQLAQLSQLNKEDQAELRRLVALVRRMRDAVGREPLPQAVLHVLQESGLIEWLRQLQLLEGDGAAAAAAQRREGRIAAEQLPPNLRAVLHKARQVLQEWQQAQQQQQTQQQQQQPGLEWPVVLIPCANEGHLPLSWRPPLVLLADWQAGRVGESEMAETRRAHFEEERRLFHVAATRARDRLLISYVQPTAAAAGPADGAFASFQAAAAASQPGSELGLSQDAPRCSSVLAATVRRLLREQPGVVRLEGQLPESASPDQYGEHLTLEEEERSQQQQSQGASAASCTGHALVAGGNARLASQSLSIAERVRQQLAAKAGRKAVPGKAVGAKPAAGGRKRAAVQMEGGG